MKQIMIISSLLLFGASAPAIAQTAGPHVRYHQINQRARIAHGKANGSLSRAEACQLHGQQRRVRQHKRIARADGQVTMRERAGIHRHQRKASANIYRKKHNALN